MEITKLDGRKSGHPLLLGAVLDKELQVNVQTLREAGAIINMAIVTAIVKQTLTVTCTSAMVVILQSLRVGPNAF